MPEHFSKAFKYISARPVMILLGFCVLLIIHVLFAHGGSFENDDFVYAYYAVKGVHTETAPCYLCDHFALRWIPVFFASAFYAFFGITEFTTALFSLCCFLITATLMYCFVSKEKLAVTFSVCILFFLNYTTIFYSHRLVADSGVMLFNFIAWYFYYRERFNQKKSTHLNAFVFGCSMVLAMLTKETIVILFPFWLLLFLTDLYKKRSVSFWLKSAAVIIIFTAIYLLYFQLTTGDWFHRYHVLQNNNYMGGAFFAPYRDAYMGKRLLYELWKAFLLNGDMQYILFAAAGLIYYKRIFRELWKRLLLFSFGILLLCCNFMSYSFSEYIPLWSDPRQFIFLMPFACLTGAYVLEAFMREPVKYPWVPVCFLIADIFLFFSELGATKYIYYGMTVVLAFRYILHAYDNMKYAAASLLIFLGAVMSASFFYDFFNTRYDFYYDQKAVIEKNFKQPDKPAVVFVGDRITTRLGEYFLSFANEKVRFCNVDTCKNFLSKSGTSYYLLVNKRYNKYFAESADSLIVNTGLQNDFHLIQQTNTARLYEVKKPGKMEIFKHYSTSKF